MAKRSVHRVGFLLLVGIAVLFGQGCSTTRFHQREALTDRSMQFDEDSGLTYIRLKIDAAREGSLGGFGAAEAGGCGCQ
jgi:hypothetical protein